MDKQERLRLEKLYFEMLDDELIRILIEDEEEFKHHPFEAYQLVKNEIMKRGLEGKGEEKKKEISGSEQKPDEIIDFEVVYRGLL